MNNKKSVYEIITLNNILKRHLLNIGKCEIPKSPPSPIQIKIMHYLIENNDRDIYQRDLERDLNLRRATLSGILNTMEKNKLLSRLPSDIDARSKKIILNEKTKEIFTKKMENLMEVENILIRGINKDELTIFLDIIDRMKNNVKKECDKNAKID